MHLSGASSRSSTRAAHEAKKLSGDHGGDGRPLAIDAALRQEHSAELNLVRQSQVAVYKSAPQQKTFTLRNTSDHTLQLWPLSDLGITVSWSRALNAVPAPSPRIVPRNNEDPLSSVFPRVGPSVVVGPASEVRAHVLLSFEGALSDDKVGFCLLDQIALSFNGVLPLFTVEI